MRAAGRLDWLDVAKGIAIILMVLGHTSIPKTISDFIWAFHMPLFFIASGWTTNWDKYNFSIFFLRKIQSLVIPFVVYTTILVFTNEIMGGGLLNFEIMFGWGGYALWFIPVLFFALIVSKLVMSIKRLWMQIFFSLLMAFWGAVLSYTKVSLPWNLCAVPYATFLIILGSNVKRYQDYISTPCWWLFVGGFLTTAMVSHSYRLDMAWNNITPVTILTIGALSGSIMMFTLSSYISKCTKYVSTMCQAVGKETYIILAFSQMTIIILNRYFSFNSAIKYLILVIVLVILKYIKDGINTLIGQKILK